jgi:acyl-CoA reductase-like NAD-dependent aldehyde dehydrogenase
MDLQRIYVHESMYDAFVEKFVEIVKVCAMPTYSGHAYQNILQKYRLGDPTEMETTLGPVVSLASAERIRKQISDACQCTCAM